VSKTTPIPQLYVNITRNLNYLCGVMNLKTFGRSRESYSRPYLIDEDMFKKWKELGGGSNDMNGGFNTGANYVEVGFIDDQLSTDVFNRLSDLFPLVFLSEKRKNLNSGNMFYFAVFDIKDFV
jgi:hypothetical protein